MHRLKLFILVFCIAVSIPLAFVIYQSYAGLKQEERGQLLYFSETIFDQMERTLAEIVLSEEGRAVDEYQHFLADGRPGIPGTQRKSPLAEPAYPDYILGYLQNNPDGSFQTPLVVDPGDVEQESRNLVTQLRLANDAFNRKKLTMGQVATETEETLDFAEVAEATPPVVIEEKQKAVFAERFLKRSDSDAAPSYLGRKQQRVEEISAGQAMNVARDHEALQPEDRVAETSSLQSSSPELEMLEDQPAPAVKTTTSWDTAAPAVKDRVSGYREKNEGNLTAPAKFQVEVAPFQSVALQDDQVYMFRRIVIDDQIYRQGFIILVTPLLNHLADTCFAGQPLAEFTSLILQRRDQPDGRASVQAGVEPSSTSFLAQRVFPRPFDFISVSLTASSLPPSPARSSLNLALFLLGGVMILGLLAIYQSARTIVALSERRSRFVSTVSHELKTPLTNIRMYIEMLEDGVAPTPEREQEYLSILGSESARLSSLINNVLELARLEKRQRHFDIQEGSLDDVLTEVEIIMTPKLDMEGFRLVLDRAEIPPFPFDREVLIQILVNLLENSIKFGRRAPERTITIGTDLIGDQVRIRVSDTGPGIPKKALRKVFDDFYRVDNDLTRATGGTGIGLSLVHKFVTALGGTVRAGNNDGPGCTITISLPLGTSFQPS